MNIDKMYQAALATIAQKSNPQLGCTSREWSKQWNVGWATARVRIRQFVDAGLMIEDRDWRPFNNGMRKEPVYRWKKGGNK